MHKLMPFLAIGLVACHEASQDRLLAPDEVSEQTTGSGHAFTAAAGHAFETEGFMTNYLILPAQALGVPTADFWGRCSGDAVWLSIFEIEGSIPHVGNVRGSASHCDYKENPADPSELPTYGDGQAWLRSANGDDIFMDYGNGTAFPLEGGPLGFKADWSFTGGTGRFLHVAGSGIQYGTFDLADLIGADPGSRFPFHFDGTIDYDVADRGLGSDFRGTFRIEMSMPYVMAGNPQDDPCMVEEGPGWLTTVMEGRGEATHLGRFTTRAEYCSNMELGQTTDRIHVGRTASGADFRMPCEDLVFDLPFIVPGLDRVYAFRSQEALIGLSGRLEGASADIHSVGHAWLEWQQAGGSWIPAFPWRMELEMAGTYRR